MMRLAVLISGGGSTLKNLLSVHERGELPVEFVGIISSRRRDVNNAAILDSVHGRGFPLVFIRRDAFDTDDEHWSALNQTLDLWQPDLIALAGYLQFWQIPERYLGRVINIHPSLLPKYGGKGCYGDVVYERVLSAGDAESGCTVHFATNVYDDGPIIVQKRVSVHSDDTVQTLRARVFAKECKAYPEAIRFIASTRLF